jgi:hypothetical protein
MTDGTDPGTGSGTFPDPTAPSWPASEPTRPIPSTEPPVAPPSPYTAPPATADPWAGSPATAPAPYLPPSYPPPAPDPAAGYPQPATTYGQPAYDQPAHGQPAYGQPTYPPPYGYPPYGAPPQSNSAALVLTIVAAVATAMCCLLFTPSLVLGIVALSKQSTDPVASARLTRYGWIAGGVTIALGILAVVLLVAAGAFGSLGGSSSYEFDGT